MGNASQSVTLSLSRSRSETQVDDDLDQFDHLEQRPKNAHPGSRTDLRDMMRMGKHQEFSRNFHFLSLVGYSIVASGTWQGLLTSGLDGIVDSTGLSNLVWTYVFVFILWLPVVASLAEMASIAPTAAGQYHWVSEFAPPRYSRILSFVTGWCAMSSWQCNFVSFCADVSEHIQSELIVGGSTFTFKPWQLAFIIMVMATFAVVLNTNINNSLPLLGGIFVLLYISSFLAIFVTLWVLGPRTDTEKVFLDMSNRGDPRGVLVSLIFNIFEPMLTLMSPDNIIHMAEEVKDSSRVLPRAMMTSTIFEGILGVLMVITFCFTVGDTQTVYASPITTHIDILFNTTRSPAMTILLTVVLDIISIGSCTCALTSASRQLFAFARDGGVPFSSTIAYIRPGWNVPLNAMLVSYIFCAIMSLLTIFWPPIIGIIVVWAVSGNVFSYLVSITCLRMKRWRNEPLPSRRWSLGRWGGPINDLAILFLAFFWILCFIPNALQVTVDNMLWNSVVWTGIILLSLIYYFVQGRKVYKGPVTLVRKGH